MTTESTPNRAARRAAKGKTAASPAAVAEARGQMVALRDDADAQLAKFETVMRFEMARPVEDKNGELTSVLIIDRDAKGWRRIQIQKGLPMSADPVNKTLKIDDELLYRYLNHMANVDLDDDDVLEAIGAKAIEGARNFLLAFFLLLWGSALSPESLTEKSNS